MPLEETLRKVEYDLLQGDYEHARQRLTGLLCHHAYPTDLKVRRMLGDLYWREGNIIEAGRFWYLEEHKTPEMIVACAHYEKVCGHKGQMILRRLKLMGDIAKLRNASRYAFDVVQELKNRAWSEFEDKYPAGNFYDSEKWYAQQHYQLQPQNHRILIVDGVGRLSRAANKLTEKVYSMPHIENRIIVEKFVSVFTVTSQKLFQLVNETNVERIEVEQLDLTMLDVKLTATTEKHGIFEAAVIWLADEILGVHEIIAKYVEDYFHILGAETLNFQQTIRTPYETFKNFPNVSYHQTVLGWIFEQGKTRWLTEDEIAAGVADAMLYRHVRWRVGAIKPWQNKPTEEVRIDS